MKLKDVSFGFVIISPEHDIDSVSITAKSMALYKGTPFVCVTSNNASTQDVKDMKEYCPTYKGGETITSLLNTGIENGNKEWNIIVMEGTKVRRGFVEKLFKFAESDLDILFPIVVDHNRQGRPIRLYTNFYDATLNGLTIHQGTFNKVGNFSDEPLHISKTYWATEAINKGCIFKAILGSRIC